MKRWKVFSRAVSVLLLMLSVALSANFSFAGETYTFGIIPQQKANVLAKAWKPILDHLSQSTGDTFVFQTAPDISQFQQAAEKGAYDFSYVNPDMYVSLSEKPGYKGFAHAKDKKITGIIVVKKDSPIQTRQDLQGKDVVFPKGAFAANLLLQAGLKQDNISISPKFTTTHDNGYIGVAKGLFSACGGVMRTFKATSPEIASQLRVLWTSQGYTPHAFAALPRVPAAVTQKVQAVMVAMEADPTQLGYLQNMKLKGIQAAQDSDWNDVRALAPFLAAVEKSQ